MVFGVVMFKKNWRGAALYAALGAWAAMFLAIGFAYASAPSSSAVSYLAHALGTDAARLRSLSEQQHLAVASAGSPLDHLLVSDFARTLILEVADLPAPPSVEDFISRLGAKIPIPGSREFVRHRSEAADAAQVYGSAVRLLELKAETARLLLRAAAAENTLLLVKRWRELATLGDALRENQSETGAVSKAQLLEAKIAEAKDSIVMTRAKLHVEDTRNALALKLNVPADALRIPTKLPDIPRTLHPAEPGSDESVRVGVLAAQWQRILSAFDQQNGSEEVLNLEDASDERISAELISARAELEGAYLLALIMHDEVLPPSRLLADERMLQYNGMLIDVLDLLSASRAHTENEIEAVAVALDYFLARVDFDLAQQAISLGSTSANAGKAPPLAPQKSEH